MNCFHARVEMSPAVAIAAAPSRPSAGGARKRSPRRLLAMLVLALSCLVLAQAANAIQVAAGWRHSLLVRDDGTLWAWGWNEYGQVGDGSLATRPAPVPVMSNVRAAVGGLYHTVVLKTDGTVWTFGMGVLGQLGVGVVPRKAVPVQVLSGVTGIAAGFRHSMALKADGSLWMWGENDKGQLGDGTTVQRSTPVQVLTGVAALGAGFQHSMAIKTDGTLWVWGRNAEGAVGDGSRINRVTPAQVLSNVVAATGGWHTLALRNDGSVWAWGGNSNGQIGNGTSLVDQLTPVQVQTGAQGIAAGAITSMAIKPGGELWLWGNGVTAPALAATNVQSAASGDSHVLAVKSDGTVEAWGSNEYGQLGDGGIVDRSFPVLALTGVRAAVGGSAHSLALKTDGSLWSWGDGGSGQLGDGLRTSRAAPARVLTGVQSAAAGQSFSMAIKTDGSLWAWGANGSGQFGDGTTISQASPVQVMSNVRAVAGGYAYTLFLKSDGTLLTAGDNNYGQLGDGGTTARATPVQIMTGVQEVAAGGSSGYALKADGTVWAWGFNVHGELGDGTGTDRLTPVQTMSGVKAIAAGNLHGLALKTDGTLWAWGYNENGQVGDGGNYSQRSPVQVMANVASIAASYYRSAAIKTDGSVWGWGENSGWGGTTPNRPVQILSLRGATGIGAGYGHTMAITAAGALYAWGNNNAGQLGIPGAASSSTPVKVRDPYSPIAGSAVVWEFYNALIRNGAGTLGAGHYFLTADAAEGAAIDSGAAGAGWQRTGRVFRAWLSKDAAPPGAAGVCRFYARGPNSHFYTADPGECAALKAANPGNDPGLGWAYESIAFYTVLPVPDPAPAPAGSIAFTAGGLHCAAGYQPVYRVYNARFSPDPAQNDSNHRITPSIGDVYRSKTYLGYADEGVAFCSPVSNAKEGGDYQAYYLYPGAEAGTAGTFKASYVFSNNGAQRGDGALAYLILPAEVTDWGVACAGYNGATCPATMNVSALREGQPVPSFPAGGFIVLTAQGTAPAAPVGTSYAAAISAPGGAPDYLLSNNVPVVSRTVVKSEAACAWVFNPGSLAFSNAPEVAQTRVITSTACRWRVASDQPWLQGAPAAGTGQADLTISAPANAGTTARSGTITLTGLDAQGQPVAGSAIVVKVAQAGTPAQPLNADSPACMTADVTSEGDQFSSDGITGSSVVSLVADTSCAWTASSDVPWVSVVQGSDGAGNGRVAFQVAENPDQELRTGEVRIANKRFTVTQMGRSDNKGSSTGGCGGDGGCGESGGDGGGGGGGDGGGDGGAGGSSGGDSG